MTELTGTIDGVIGVDTHRDSLAAAATDPVGGVLAQTSVSADAAGYQQLLAFARAQVPGRRCWAVEGAGSYGAGLTAFLQAHGERVVEVGGPSDQPAGPAPRATPWTRSGPAGKRSAASGWPARASGASVRRYGCCRSPGPTPVATSRRCW
jgi:transposase